MRLSTSSSSVTHNGRVKRYADGSGEVLAAQRKVFRAAGWELSDKWDRRYSEDPLLPQDAEAQNAEDERRGKVEFDDVMRAETERAARQRAQRRARTQVRDLARCNEFRYFVTLTLDARSVDRYDAAAVTRKLNTWLDNAVRRYGLKYVLVPELHKDGAIHFHGFINDALRVVDSGTVIPPEGGKPKRPRSARQREAWLREGGHIVYNLPQWKCGFTTALELYGDYNAAVGYVCKYINKEQTKVGGRWFYHGGDLRRPEVETVDVDFDELEQAGAAIFTTPTLRGVKFAVMGFDKEGDLKDGRIEAERGQAAARRKSGA